MPLASRLRARTRAALTPLDRPLLYTGRAVGCPCCGGRFRRLQSHGGTRNVRCPRCHSYNRHRTLWLYLEREGVLKNEPTVLHVAPERGIAARVRSVPGVNYVSVDRDPRLAMVPADLTSLDFHDAEFDLVICCHVLEHIPDDMAAMREMRRVLRPGGTALLQHPIDHSSKETYEDPSIVSRELREAAFGQWDHVRLYGRDFQARLESAGFAVTVEHYVDTLEPELVRRFCLREPPSAIRGDDIYTCARAEDR